MHIIVCLDDQNGMAFNHRRQSRDRVVTEDICILADGRPLWMNKKSAALFSEASCAATLRVDEDFLAAAPDDALCFVEDAPLAQLLTRIDRLTIYRWNRRYPADLYFDLSLDGWRLTGGGEFQGYSHDKITREDYTR